MLQQLPLATKGHKIPEDFFLVFKYVLQKNNDIFYKFLP
jgi:hypothetical protein